MQLPKATVLKREDVVPNSQEYRSLEAVRFRKQGFRRGQIEQTANSLEECGHMFEY